MAEKHLPVRIEEALLKKYHYVCKYDGRSANSDLRVYIRQRVEDFEREHGIIELPEDSKSKREGRT